MSGVVALRASPSMSSLTEAIGVAPPFRIGAVEWTVLVPVTLFMLGVSLLVAYVSARPWIAVDPMEAVRHS